MLNSSELQQHAHKHLTIMQIPRLIKNHIDFFSLISSSDGRIRCMMIINRYKI